MRLGYPICWAATLIASIGIGFLPLFERLGYEFSAFSGLIVSLGAGYIAAGYAADLRLRSPSGGAGEVLVTALGGAALRGLPVLILPLIIALVRSAFVGFCSPRNGLLFYLLIPGVSFIYGLSAGLFFGLLASSPLKGYLLFLAYIAWTFIWAGYLLLFQPQVFVYSSTFGFFPGPIYDERVTITSQLIAARLITLLLSALFISLILNTLNPSAMRLELAALFRWDDKPLSILSKLSSAALALSYLIVLLLGGRIGVMSTRGFIRRELGGVCETEHFVIYYPKGSEAEREIELIAEDHEFRYWQLSKFLKVEPPGKVRSYIYPSPDVKKRLMGARGTSIEDPIGLEIHLNYRPFPHPVLKHELAHIFSAAFHPFLRMSLKVGLHEGLAVAADWSEERLTPHQWAKAMLTLGVAPSMKRLMGAIGFWTENPSRAYMAAGSFVRFLIERYGVERFRIVYPLGNFRKAYGKPLEELVGEWRVFLEKVTLSEEDLSYAKNALLGPPMLKRRCPHEVADLIERAEGRIAARDYRGALELLTRAYVMSGCDPRPLALMALCRFRLGEMKGAEEMAREVLNHPRSTPGMRARMWELIGDIRWLSGLDDEAREAYEEALKLGPPPSLRRGLIIKIESIGREGGRLIMKGLMSDAEMGVRMAYIVEAAHAGEVKHLACYLAGRWLYMMRDFEGALEYMSRVTGGMLDKLPDDSFRYESFRIKGESLYRLGKTDEALGAFEGMRRFAGCPAERLRAEDWIERCRWRIHVRGDPSG